MIISDPMDEQEHIYANDDCPNCKQTKENCECHIPFEEKHKGLIQLTKAILDGDIKLDEK